MSIATKIQWCDSTCNPTMGCEGCELWTTKVKRCYAGTLHVRFGGVTRGYSPTFEELTFWPGRMAEAAQWSDLTGRARTEKSWLEGLPRLIFVSDMSDALSAAVPFPFLEEEVIGAVISRDGQRHHWLWLTKRPDRMAQLSDTLKAKGVPWPKNLWAGTSITTQATTSRIKQLLRVGDEQSIRFLSVEPQHEEIGLAEWLPRLDWIIQGGESGRGATPFHLEWAQELRWQCKEAGVAFFLKQLGSAVFSKGHRLRFRDGHAGDWSEWPKEVRVREMPRRIVARVRQDALRMFMDGNTAQTDARVSLVVVDGKCKGQQAARKAWETRRRKKQEQKQSETALSRRNPEKERTEKEERDGDEGMKHS